MRVSFRGNNNEAIWLQYLMLVGIVFDLALIGLSLLLNPSLLESTNIVTSLGPVVLLLLYAGLTVVFSRGANQNRLRILRQATFFGLFVALVFLIDIIIEDFVDAPSGVSLYSTIGFMLVIFTLFGTTGFFATKQSGKFSLGVLASVWCAMLSIVVLVFFGFVVNFFFRERFEFIFASDFARSGMTNPRAFTFYNTLDAAFSHLLEAPILAAIFGSLGSLIALGYNQIVKGSKASGLPL